MTEFYSRKVILLIVVTELLQVKKKKEKMPDDLITLAQAAKLKGYKSASAISQLIRRGHIRRYEQFEKPLVSQSEVLTYEPVKPGPKPKASGMDGKVTVKPSKKASKK